MEAMIVFDLGGVLSSDAGKEAVTAEILGVPVDTLIGPYWAHRQGYDEGDGNLDYWSKIGADLGIEVDQTMADRLGVADADAWVDIRPTAFQILAELKAADVPTAVLSNAPIEMYEAIDRAPWRDLVGPVFVSGVLGVAKPSLEIYRHVAQAVDLSSDELYFIDDKSINVHGAIAAGWRPHLWVSDEDTRAWLVTIGVLPELH